MILFKMEHIARGDNVPYLERFIVFKCQWFGVFVHKFLSSDDECEHNHPWSFVSWLLSGPYDEIVESKRTSYPRWSLLYRPASWRHRVELTHGSVITLVLHGPRTQKWGFFTKLGWIPWYKYDHAKHCSE